MSTKQALRMAGFCALAALMLAGLTWLLRDRETSLSSLYSEPRDTVDVFIVGSSHVNSGYIPGVLWKEYGISAHNVYSWSQPLWTGYHYIKEGLKTQSPSVVVLDLNGLMYGNSNEQPQDTDAINYRNSFSIDPGFNLWQLCQTVATCGIDLRDPIDFWPLMHYHTRWKVLDEAAFTYDAHRDPSYLKGYGFQVLVTPNSRPQAAEPQQSMTPYETAAEYLEKIVALSREEGFALVLVLTPYAWQPNEPAIYRWIEEYAAANGLPFYNYNGADGERIGLDWAQDFCDPSHVNYKGALKLTRDLGVQLTQAGAYALRTPEQLPNREALDRDAAKMYRTIDLWEAIQQPPATALPWLMQNGILTVAVSGASSLPAQAAQALAALGCHLPPQGDAYAAVCSGGAVQEQSAQAGQGCAVQALDGALAVQADAQQASIGLQGVDCAAGSGAYLAYYDTVLERMVYRIDITQDGELLYTDVSSPEAGGAA